MIPKFEAEKTACTLGLQHKHSTRLVMTEEAEEYYRDSIDGWVAERLGNCIAEAVEPDRSRRPGSAWTNEYHASLYTMNEKDLTAFVHLVMEHTERYVKERDRKNPR